MVGPPYQAHPVGKPLSILQNLKVYVIFEEGVGQRQLVHLLGAFVPSWYRRFSPQHCDSTSHSKGS